MTKILKASLIQLTPFNATLAWGYIAANEAKKW